MEEAVLTCGGLGLRHGAACVQQSRPPRQPRFRKSLAFPGPAISRMFTWAPAACGFSRGRGSARRGRRTRIGKDVGPMELVTGATGYVGSRLVRRLAAEGRGVRALARRPERVERLPGVEAVGADLLGRRAARRTLLEGCETAYYLVHSMEGGERQRGRLRRPRPARGHRVRRGGRGRRGGADRLPGRHRAGGRRPPRTCARGSRWRRSCSAPCPAPPPCAHRS